MKIAIMNDPHYAFNGEASRKIHERFSSLLQSRIEANSVEVLIVAGDIATNKQEQIEAFFKLYRSKISIPILVVFGNHDYWDDKAWVGDRYRTRGIGELIELHKEMCAKYDIQYLGDRSVQIKDVLFCGYDGWYDDIDPGTNDLHHMQKWHESAPVHQYMNYRAHKEADRVLSEASDSNSLIKVLVSHFDCVPHKYLGSKHRGPERHLKAQSEVFNTIIYGHTHTQHEAKVGEAMVLSTGSDYNHPVSMIFDLATQKSLEFVKLPWTKRDRI